MLREKVDSTSAVSISKNIVKAFVTFRELKQSELKKGTFFLNKI